LFEKIAPKMKEGNETSSVSVHSFSSRKLEIISLKAGLLAFPVFVSFPSARGRQWI
jgi:hypothetical protein